MGARLISLFDPLVNIIHAGLQACQPACIAIQRLPQGTRSRTSGHFPHGHEVLRAGRARQQFLVHVRFASSDLFKGLREQIPRQFIKPHAA